MSKFKETTFAKSLKKVKLNILLIMLLALAPAVLTFLGYLLLMRLLSAQAAGISMPSNLLDLNYEDASVFLSKTRMFYYSMIGYPIALVLVTIVLFSLSQGGIYTIMAGKKNESKFYVRFILLNFAWNLPWIIILTASFFVIRADLLKYLIPLLIFLWLHFTLTLHILFAHESRFSKIKEALRIGTKKLHKFAVPYLMIIALFGLSVLVASILSYIPVISVALIITTFLFFIALSRIYLAEVIKELS